MHSTFLDGGAREPAYRYYQRESDGAPRRLIAAHERYEEARDSSFHVIGAHCGDGGGAGLSMPLLSSGDDALLMAQDAANAVAGGNAAGAAVRLAASPAAQEEPGAGASALPRTGSVVDPAGAPPILASEADGVLTVLHSNVSGVVDDLGCPRTFASWGLGPSWPGSPAHIKAEQATASKAKQIK